MTNSLNSGTDSCPKNQSVHSSESEMSLPITLGKATNNEVIIVDLAKMPHLLIAGATGQGKTMALNVIITSLLFNKRPHELKFVLIDPKKVEFDEYNKIELQYLAKLPGDDKAVVTDVFAAIDTLNALCNEMDRRYNILRESGVRSIDEYNQNSGEGHLPLPYIVVVIDEYADLVMMEGENIETPLIKLAMLARAVGIHLVVATQRPTPEVLTSALKANFPGRIAFRVNSSEDSRTIIDSEGAQRLNGNGDMLFSCNGTSQRLQGTYISDDEIAAIVNDIASHQNDASSYILS